MVMPTNQTCPKCRRPFVGSDAVGHPCPACATDVVAVPARDGYQTAVLPFNGLSPAEAERLAWFMEECAEAQQEAAKILRHGYASHNPCAPQHPGNRAELTKEVGHVLAAIDRLVHTCDISAPIVEDHRARKWRRDGTGHGYHTHEAAP